MHSTIIPMILFDCRPIVGSRTFNALSMLGRSLFCSFFIVLLGLVNWIGLIICCFCAKLVLLSNCSLSSFPVPVLDCQLYCTKFVLISIDFGEWQRVYIFRERERVAEIDRQRERERVAQIDRKREREREIVVFVSRFGMSHVWGKGKYGVFWHCVSARMLYLMKI